MKDVFYFEKICERETWTKIVEAIPIGWGGMSGRLVAPKEAIAARMPIAENTGYQVYNDYRFLGVAIVGDFPRDEKGRRIPFKEDRMKPNSAEIMLEGKLPNFIDLCGNRFGHSASSGYVDTYVEAEKKSIAISYLAKGYYGRLYFAAHYRKKYCPEDNPARCKMVFNSFCRPAGDLGESWLQKVHIELRWIQDNEGKLEDIASIRDSYRLLELPECEPKSDDE
ncbi:MAG: hypothetical protein WC519_02460 [Parcubacteria group bacterium]